MGTVQQACNDTIEKKKLRGKEAQNNNKQKETNWDPNSLLFMGKKEQAC